MVFHCCYVCHTDLLNELSKNSKIYILSKNSQSTKKNIGLENISYVQYDEDLIEEYKFSSKFYNFLESLRTICFGGNYKTPKIIFEFTYKKNTTKYFLYNLMMLLLNRFKFLRKLLLLIQSNFYPKSLVNIIKNIGPDLVLTTSIGTFSYDEYVLRIAKKLNIKSATSILSWDNTTTRDM